jgi:hypothetical protein
MAVSYKILGQSAPTSGSVVTLYTVPSSTNAIVSSIIICNRDTTTSTFNVSVLKNGNTASNKDFIYSDLSVEGNDTFVANIGITLDIGDKVIVASSSDNLSFSLFGSEIT